MNPFTEIYRQLDQDITQSPTPAPTTPPVAPTKSDSSHFGSFLLFLLTVGVGLGGWWYYHRWQRRREQRLLAHRSAAADRVLGDMQMVPNADLDDVENELL